MKIFKLTIYLFIFFPACLFSNIEILEKYIKNYKMVGQGRMSYIFWDLYDAKLFSPDGKWSWNKPFALSLTYLINLNGEEIAKESISQIKSQGFNNNKSLRKWYKLMRNIFPNVRNGTTLFGIQDEDGNTIFYSGKKMLGKISDKKFSKRFFGIWLSKNTSEPLFRRKLLGLPN